MDKQLVSHWNLTSCQPHRVTSGQGRKRIVVVKWILLVKGGSVGTNMWVTVVVWDDHEEDDDEEEDGCSQMEHVSEGWQCRDKRVDDVCHMKLLLFFFFVFFTLCLCGVLL